MARLFLIVWGKRRRKTEDRRRKMEDGREDGRLM